MGYRTSKVEKELAITRNYWKNFRKIEDLEKGLKKLESSKAAPAAAKPTPTPTPTPKPKPQPKEPTKHSPEIKQAKERVNKYQDDVMSGNTSEKVYDVGSNERSFIKPSSSDFNQQVDFSANAFEAKEPSKPDEQAQTQMQDYVAKIRSI